MRRLRWQTSVGMVLCALAVRSNAHPMTVTGTTVFLPGDGTFVAELIVDLDALALGAPPGADDAGLAAELTAMTATEFTEQVEGVRRLFERRVRFRFDDRPEPFKVTFPDYGTPAATEADIPTVLGVTARLEGVVPEGAMELEFFASRAFSEVDLVIRDEARDVTHRALLERGARSDPFLLVGPVEPPSGPALARQYLRLGLVHIVPRGLDHILFVLGLFLLSTQLRALVWQVTAFTLAHAVTLSLAVFEVVSLPARIVEPLIALSIVYVAVENLVTSRLMPWRPAVVFGFGLLHGLGFAEILRELGLPTEHQGLGLVSFNLGIEIGQLLVIGAALTLVGWCRHRAWYRPRVVMPVSGVIALTGLFWALARASPG